MIVRTDTPEATVDVGVVGCGHIATTTHLPLLAAMDDVRIRYVADVDRSRLRTLSGSYDTSTVVIDGEPSDLPDCDVVLLSMPVGVRGQYIHEFGDRGTPIFSEKPFARSPESHAQFLDAADEVTCNYHRTCLNSTRQMRTLLRTGAFGRLRRVRIAEGGVVGATGRSSETYMSDGSVRGSGILTDRGCHLLSQLLYLLQEWTFTVTEADILLHDGFDVDIDATLVASREGRSCEVSFELTRVRPLDTVAEFVFENAVVVFDPEEPTANVAILTDEDRSQLELVPGDSWATTFAQAHYLRWRQFLSEIRDGTRDDSELRTAPEITELTDAVYEMATIQEDAA